jgi:hypothetical protein
MLRGDPERLWPARLRWRLRGATLWPAFVVAIVVDTVLLRVLPIAGDGDGEKVFGALLLATFFNLVTVAVLAPLGGWLLRRQQPSLPVVVAHDRAGTALVGVLAVALAVGGLLHRPAVLDARRAFARQAAAARAYLRANAPPEYRANIAFLSTWRQSRDLFRTCVPGPDPDRWLCLYIRTDVSPPSVRPDPDHQSNSRLAGPDNPGRNAP